MQNELNIISTKDLVLKNRVDRHREEKRHHLGCSVLGHHCDRWLWLSFRWAVTEAFDGRMLRLFNRGHREEPVVYAELEAAGVTVEGTQDRVSFSHHIGGSIDGRVLGLPEAPKTWHVLEIKTHSLKSFKSVSEQGVKAAKYQHWAQMQLYMRGLRLTRALYYAVCKDNDGLYLERVEYEAESADLLVARGLRLTMSERIPEPCSGASPSWYLCKFCAAYPVCHEAQPTREVNCRTCSHVTPVDDGWRCEKWASNVPAEHQGAGCPSHVLHPDLVPWKRESIGEQWHAAYNEHINGDPSELDGAKTSREILNDHFRQI